MNTAPAVARSWPAVDDFLHLAYRGDLHRLVGRWRRPVSAAELRRGYRAMLAAAEAAACPFWVVDVRSRDALDADVAQWLAAAFPLRPAGGLAGPLYLAYLVSPRHRAQVARPTAEVVDGTEVAFFEDEGALNNWLAQQQGGPVTAR